jgi:hypothetical protein
LVVKDTLPSLGSDVLMVSIDVDTTENADQLRRFAEQHGFGWRFALAPREMLVELQRVFGTQFLTPPSEPMFIVDPKGEAHLVPFGHRDANTVRMLVDRYRA